MRLNETNMPSEEEWERFFRPAAALRKLGLTDGMTVADFGCGYGTFSLAAAKIVGPKGTVYAVDIDREMVRRVKARAEGAGLANVKAIVGDIDSSKGRLPLLPMRTADFVILANVIHGARDKIRLLKRASSIARPGGKVAVLNWKIAETPRGPPMEIRPTPEQTERYFIEAGLTNPEVLGIPPYHYAVVARSSSVMNPSGRQFLSRHAKK